jgi:hypothetical protein
LELSKQIGHSMKETKQFKISKLTEVEKEALIQEVADKLPKTSLFPEKVARAKALLEIAVFPSNFPSIKSKGSSY